MPRRKEISEILKLMENTDQIKNIGLVGHIDHGKTTLSDSLLSEAGLLSPDLAGEARALDYLEEEQKRGITMKSTNISLYYENKKEKAEPYIINLVDTPGHLDFSGKVTRALRLIDGVVVVVDAVEEIIAQSETVIRQALDEGVRPILYINKVDRLIRELMLTDDQIRKKYVRIINDFNTLIKRHADPPFNEAWQVSPSAGNVAFGSALHKWGFTLKILEESDLKFNEIRERYKKQTINERNYEDLPVYFPISQAILEMVVKHIPNPREAQKYKIKKIWEGKIDSEIGASMVNCNPEGPLVICLSKVQADKHGLVATGRIFSGTCLKRSEVFLKNENDYANIQRTAIFMGQHREQVDKVPVGNIVAIEGLKEIRSGETIVDPDYINDMPPFENVKYVTTPVVTVSIEPEYLRDLEQMKQLIEHLLIEDPNLTFQINEENGEYLLSGMGSLHLEVTKDEIEKRGVKVGISEPRAVFKESCRYKSSLISSKSPDGEHELHLKVERLDQNTASALLRLDHPIYRTKHEILPDLLEKTSLTRDETKDILLIDRDQNVLIIDSLQSLNENYQENLIEVFQKIQSNGLLCGEKLTELKIIMKDFNFQGLDPEEAFTEISSLFYNAMKEALSDAELVLLEPIYHTVIQLPPEYMTKIVSLLSKHSAKIISVNQENDYQGNIEILIPVRNSIKFAEDIRSSSSGKAFWQNEFHSFKEVPIHEANKIIADLRFVKGLSW